MHYGYLIMHTKGRNLFLREVCSMNSLKFCEEMLHSPIFQLPATLPGYFTSQFKFNPKNEDLKKLQQN